jgi:hypothetical protein
MHAACCEKVNAGVDLVCASTVYCANTFPLNSCVYFFPLHFSPLDTKAKKLIVTIVIHTHEKKATLP